MLKHNPQPPNELHQDLKNGAWYVMEKALYVASDTGAVELTAEVLCPNCFQNYIACCEKCAKSVPTNYIVLFSFTACEAVMLGLTCLFVNASAVGLAAAMTALVTAGLTVYAVTTKTDYSAMGHYFFAALLTVIVFGFVGSIFSMFFHVPWLQNVYAGCGCLVFSMYIVYDTQLIVGSIGNGERHGQFQIGYDDYVFAALNIYLDIINLFQYILILLNSRD